MNKNGFQLQHHRNISALEGVWQKFTAHDNAQPFIDFHFLHALEITDCLTPDTGWYPHHLSLHDGDNNIVALMPLYLKNNSYGEYVFDHAWANAWQQAGGDYYPKLLSAIPFTPITGERLLIAPNQDAKAIKPLLLQGFINLCRQYQLSSAHINFLPEADIALCEQENLLIRRDTQFHWVNDDYQNFDDFLNALISRKRKNIRKERDTMKRDNVTFKHLNGDDITPADWDIFYQFYCSTYARKWGYPYLTRSFFEELHQRIKQQILLIMAYHDSTPIGAALNFCDNHRLYGRNWGCEAHYPFLHFETCYYQAIDYAIQHKLKYVEAGTQGQHKLDRGYQPVTVYSAHYLNHPNFRDAVANFIDHETEHHQQTQAILLDHSPFKKPV
ncbi:MAG: GNAT family N-acetyltransferase [Alphaproteobacteria bacterium]|nr:GNAT family N-acetyltransferase [Alphaproteobacteria bacterium]